MKPSNPRILTINGGSSSIKFALFEAGDPLQRILQGAIERSGHAGVRRWHRRECAHGPRANL
jgi:acetate kinase